MYARAIVRTNRGMCPCVTMNGTVLNFTCYAPPWLQMRRPDVDPLIERCELGMVEYVEVNGINLEGYETGAEGLRTIREALLYTERRLVRQNSSNQFWLCLARALGVTP